LAEAASRWRSEVVWRSVVLATVLFALANALYSAWVEDWTYDEPFHLEWSETLLNNRIADRHSQHFNSKTPVMLPNVLARSALRRVTGAEPALRFASRLPSLLWLATLLLTTFLLGRRLFGADAAFIATAATALDPNLVAHGSVATVDAVYSLATLLTVAAALRFSEGPTPWRAARLGGALGFALAAKFSAVLLLPALLLLPVLRRPPRREWPSWVGGALLVGAVAAATISAAYLFVDVAVPVGAHRWSSAPLARLASVWPRLRLPLPDGFLTGLDASLAAERGDWNVVLLSRWFPHGVWFYFAVLWLLKTPLLVLLAEVCGLWRLARDGRAAVSLGPQILLTTLVLHLGYFSLLFRTQVGYRFVLMCIPLAYLLAAAGLAPLATRRWAPAAAAAVVVVAVIENGMYFGNPIAFTNAGVWPKRQAFRLLADSNLDWGQNDEKIQDWLARHPGSRTRFDPPHFLPGRNIFSVNEVAGVSEFARHRFLRENLDPVAHLRHTHVFFDVDEDLFSRFMDAERTLRPTAEDEAACPAGLAYGGLPPGSEANLFLPGLAGTWKTWLVCVSTREGADFGLRVFRGRLHLGPYREGTPCEGEVVGDGQEVWHRLAAGSHALCAAEMPDQSWAPHPFEGWWLARRGEASLYVREDSDRFTELDAPARRRPSRGAR
jgi:4-amino-4-deoxy-L-arabinose transferase-like glycosyltransferase